MSTLNITVERQSEILVLAKQAKSTYSDLLNIVVKEVIPAVAEGGSATFLNQIVKQLTPAQRKETVGIIKQYLGHEVTDKGTIGKRQSEKVQAKCNARREEFIKSRRGVLSEQKLIADKRAADKPKLTDKQIKEQKIERDKKALIKSASSLISDGLNPAEIIAILNAALEAPEKDAA